VPGVESKVALKAAKEAAQTISVDLDTSKGDVGDIAKAISECDTPHKAKIAPSAALIVSAPGLTADNKSQIKEALKDVKGVDGAETKCDVKKQEIYVGLSAKGGAKVADITKALEQFTKK
jgi:F0F1-type ATP synthase delta subunit